MKNLYKILIPVLLLVMGCDPTGTTGNSTLFSQLSWDIKNLESLGSKFQYEGWIMVGGSPVSTGTFTVDNNGALSVTSISAGGSPKLTEKQISEATDFIISIEPIPDPDPAPAKTKILSGTFKETVASLTADLVVDLKTLKAVTNPSTAGHQYDVLVATGDGSAAQRYSGVWFVKTQEHSKAGLLLPKLSDGWKYEGWVVVNGIPLTTGTFTDPGKKDDAAPFSGPGGPNYPGEDFLNNAPDGVTFPLDIRGSTVVVSIEPDPDNNPAPFSLKPLTHKIPNPIPANTDLKMDTSEATFPTGMVTKKKP